MILDLILAIVLFLLTLSLLPLMFLVLRNYRRHKRNVVDGMARLDGAYLDYIGWAARSYVREWDILAPFQYGWSHWGRLVQSQNSTLLRVLLHGLPNSANIPPELRNAAKKYRWYSAGLALFFGGFILLPGFYSIVGRIADFTGWPVEVFWLLSGIALFSVIFLPPEKLKKWPVPESEE